MRIQERPLRALAIAGMTASCLALPACAPDPYVFEDFHELASRALGGDAERIEFTGSGWDACLGQAWDVTEGWARWELTNYRRAIDYGNGSSIQSAMRRAGMEPDRVGGCGGQVDAAASAQQSSIRDDAGFTARLPIWLTPHGILALAESGEPAIAPADDGAGFTLTVPIIDDGVTYRLVADYGEDFLPARARTWIDDPVFGDMEVAAEFGPYRNFDGVFFPQSLTIVQGGLTQFELAIDSVSVPAEALEIPPARGFGGGGGGATAGDTPAWFEIGDGVFVLPGAYQGVAVEFDDFVVIVDSMQSDARTAEVIRLAHEAIPDKPIRYAVVTHSHFDHISGIRQLVAEGATVISHAIDAEFLGEALGTPRTLTRNRIEPAAVDPRIIGISETLTISDGSGQRIDIVPLAPSPHAADMLIAYLPSIRTAVEADILQPWINPIFAGSGDGPNPYLVYLHDEITRLGLDVARFVPIHQPPEPPTMPFSALEEALGLR